MGSLTVAVSFVLGCACSAVAAQERSPELWQGEPTIRRLAPRDFPTAPRDVVNDLLHQSYTIPQAFDFAKPHNMVRGDFDGDRLLDWAVLGTRSGFSEILVFWRGSAANVTRIALSKDANYLQSTGGAGADEVGYSRRISVVGRREILRYHRYFGGPKPPPITHSGIEDWFVNKGSSIYYYYRQQWHVLQGAD
jgi:hypothetical protein